MAIDEHCPPDPIDQVTSQWNSTCPELDATAMAVPARIQRLARHIDSAIATNLTAYGYERWQLDVLSTLRRASHALTAGELCAGSMISGSAMTNRVDKLEAAGLLTRTTNPDNRRCVRIMLTDKGRDVVDSIMPSHLDTCRNVLTALTPDEVTELDRLLRKALAPHH